MKVLVLNCGSSSVKFEVIETSLEAIDNETEQKLGRGLIDKIGMSNSTVKFTVPGRKPYVAATPIFDHSAAIHEVIRLLTDPQIGIVQNPEEIEAVGHRVLHGGSLFSASTLITEEVVDKIRECFELGPLHNPHNLKGYELMKEALPKAPHVAVFDTAFHQTMPEHAYLYALPYNLYEKHHLRRYGFHGTSHRFMVYALEQRFIGVPRTNFKCITVHLGNGCSISAVDGGRCVDTSMGLTPLEGLIMGTRCGDIDPAAVLYVMGKEDLTAAEMNTTMNKFSGLLGMSGVSSDVRELLKAWKEDGNKRAELALTAFAYRARKYIGAYHAALGGADYICFAGGVGENSPIMREMILSGLEKLGIEVDSEKNDALPSNGGEISKEGSKVRTFVVPTDEELVIARDTVRAINGITKDPSAPLIRRSQVVGAAK